MCLVDLKRKFNYLEKVVTNLWNIIKALDINRSYFLFVYFYLSCKTHITHHSLISIKEHTIPF